MKRLLVFSALLSFLLTACGSASPSRPGADDVADLGTFETGQPVTFHIQDTVSVCNEDLAYTIVQVTEAGERRVMLQHSCLGIVGRGIDQYCEDGQVKTVDVIYCSDSIFCEDRALDEQVVWDQQEYVPISEPCAGQTIQREVRQQVPPGTYHVIVSNWKAGHVESRVFAEFVVAPN